MKVKELSKAIGDFELNNIPRFFKASCLFMIHLLLGGLYFVSTLVIKYWYIYTVGILWALFESRSVIWKDPEYYSWYTHIGPISIGDEGMAGVGVGIVGMVIAYKIVKKLGPLYKRS
jgi:hypothetical protein